MISNTKYTAGVKPWIQYSNKNILIPVLRQKPEKFQHLIIFL